MREPTPDLDRLGWGLVLAFLLIGLVRWFIQWRGF